MLLFVECCRRHSISSKEEGQNAFIQMRKTKRKGAFQLKHVVVMAKYHVTLRNLLFLNKPSGVSAERLGDLDLPK